MCFNAVCFACDEACCWSAVVGDLRQVDEDSNSDDDEVGKKNENIDEDDDDGVDSTCYSNTVFNVDEQEQTDFTSSTGDSAPGNNGRVSRSVRSVQFDVNDHQEPADPRPQFTTVVTKERRPTLFDKKFQGRRKNFCYLFAVVI